MNTATHEQTTTDAAAANGAQAVTRVLPHSEQEFIKKGVRMEVVCADCGNTFPCPTYTNARTEARLWEVGGE